MKLAELLNERKTVNEEIKMMKQRPERSEVGRGKGRHGSGVG